MGIPLRCRALVCSVVWCSGREACFSCNTTASLAARVPLFPCTVLPAALLSPPGIRRCLTLACLYPLFTVWACGSFSLWLICICYSAFPFYLPCTGLLLASVWVLWGFYWWLGMRFPFCVAGVTLSACYLLGGSLFFSMATGAYSLRASACMGLLRLWWVIWLFWVLRICSVCCLLSLGEGGPSSGLFCVWCCSGGCSNCYDSDCWAEVSF